MAAGRLGSRKERSRKQCKAVASNPAHSDSTSSRKASSPEGSMTGSHTSQGSCIQIHDPTGGHFSFKLSQYICYVTIHPSTYY